MVLLIIITNPFSLFLVGSTFGPFGIGFLWALNGGGSVCALIWGSKGGETFRGVPHGLEGAPEKEPKLGEFWLKATNFSGVPTPFSLGIPLGTLFGFGLGWPLSTFFGALGVFPTWPGWVGVKPNFGFSTFWVNPFPLERRLGTLGSRLRAQFFNKLFGPPNFFQEKTPKKG